MSWVKPYKTRIDPDRLKKLRGIHPCRPTPGPADFDTLPAFKKSTRHTEGLSSTFGRSRSDRHGTSHLGRRLSKGGAEPGPGEYHVNHDSKKSPWKGRGLNSRGGSMSRSGRDAAQRLSSVLQVPGELPTKSPGPGAYIDARFRPRSALSFPKQGRGLGAASFKDKKKRLKLLKKFPHKHDPEVMEPAPNQYRPKSALVTRAVPKHGFGQGSRWPGDLVPFANMNGDYGSKFSHTRAIAQAHARAGRKAQKRENEIAAAIAAVMEEADDRHRRELRGGGDV